MRIRAAGVPGLLLAAALVAPASAQPAPAPDPEEDLAPSRGAPVPPRKEGEYGGVQPGQRPRAAVGKPARPPRPGTVSWLGFASAGQTATVWVQAAGELSFSQRVEGNTLVVTLEGARSLARNVLRPIDTRFFDGPVARVSIKKVPARKGRKAGAEVRILFEDARDARDAATRTAVEADGLWYLYLELSGAGAAPPESAAPPAAGDPG